MVVPILGLLSRTTFLLHPLIHTEYTADEKLWYTRMVTPRGGDTGKRKVNAKMFY